MTDTVFDSQPTLGPSEVSEIAGVSPDSQRDWRRRGTIEGIGTLQPNGRWLYDRFDVLILSIMRQLTEAHVDILAARRISSLIAHRVVVWAIEERGICAKVASGRYSVAYSTGEASQQWQVYTPPTWRAFDDNPDLGPATILIDCKALGASLPGEFDEWLKPVAARIKEIADQVEEES